MNFGLAILTQSMERRQNYAIHFIINVKTEDFQARIQRFKDVSQTD